MWPCIIKQKVDPDNLRKVGPLIIGWFDNPSNAERPNKQDAQCLLIDTGSAGVGIDEGTAKSLDLQKSRSRDIYGIAGKQPSSVYQAALFIPVTTAESQEILFGIRIEVIGVKELVKSQTQSGILRPDGSSAGVVGIIGRSFLQFCDMDYNGKNGEFELRIYEEVNRPRSG